MRQHHLEAEIDPADVGVCHCTDCQQLSGTAFNTYVFAGTAGFKLSGWCRSALDWVMELGSVKQIPREP